MSEQLLTILKLCLLALLYLFFLRVLRAVWAELRTPAPADGGATAPRAAATSPAPARTTPAPRRGRSSGPTELVTVDPADRAGRSWPIGDEATVGRAAGCAISLPDDTYVSTLHARVFRTGDGEVKVEDLGSTNGTYVNRTKVGGPVTLRRGDRIQVGGTTLEAR
jgi:pSer/pThr/pTyr-binding forkhead associated (FHA) protein